QPSHVETGDVVAHEAARDLDAGCFEHGRDLSEHEVELDQRRAAQTIDDDDRAIAGADGLGCLDGVKADPHDLLGTDELLATASGLAVDADPDLDLIVGQVEAGFTSSGRGAGG